MKNILVTQTVLYSKKRGYAFALSKDWTDYAKKIGFNLIPYNYYFSNKFFEKMKIDGVIFSGGNDLHLKKRNKENIFRDANEIRLFKYFFKKKIPILCVCRGFQLIAYYFKSTLKFSKNHVRKKHNLNIEKSKYTKNLKLKVNSFHNYCIHSLSKKFNIVARHKDQSIEMAEHKHKRISCIMFHPERKNGSQKQVDNFFKLFFNIK